MLNLTPLPVSCLAPRLTHCFGERRSRRISCQVGDKLAYDPKRPNYVLQTPIPTMTRMFNELTLDARKKLVHEFGKPAKTTLQRMKTVIVSDLRAKVGYAVKPKRKVTAHDPHSERGPPDRDADPSHLNRK